MKTSNRTRPHIPQKPSAIQSAKPAASQPENPVLPVVEINDTLKYAIVDVANALEHDQPLTVEQIHAGLAGSQHRVIPLKQIAEILDLLYCMGAASCTNGAWTSVETYPEMFQKLLEIRHANDMERAQRRVGGLLALLTSKLVDDVGEEGHQGSSVYDPVKAAHLSCWVELIGEAQDILNKAVESGQSLTRELRQLAGMPA